MRTAAIIMIGDEVVSGLVEEDATHFLGVALRQVLPCPTALLPYCPIPSLKLMPYALAELN
jgi:hypothetical protein